MSRPYLLLKDLGWVSEYGRVLDPYASRRRWWEGLDTQRTVFTDRYDVQTPGTVQASVTQLPFAANTFQQVCADPPHFIRKSKFKGSSRFASSSTEGRTYFGAYPTRDALLTEWVEAAYELHRVTIPNATLIWKSIDGAKTVSQCCCNTDRDITLSEYWTLMDEIQVPSAMPWSSANTVFSLWMRRNNV